MFFGLYAFFFSIFANENIENLKIIGSKNDSKSAESER